jgi:hypothetical protein
MIVRKDSATGDTHLILGDWTTLPGLGVTERTLTVVGSGTTNMAMVTSGKRVLNFAATDSVLGQMYAYDYAGGTGMPLYLNQFGGNVGIGQAAAAVALDVLGQVKGSTGVLAGASLRSSGAVAPNNNVVGSVGDLYTNTSGGAGTTLYVKETGNGTNTGWVAK